MTNVRSIIAGCCVGVATLAGGAVATHRDDFLVAVRTAFADTPPGDVANIARDLIGKVRERVRNGKPLSVVLNICEVSDEGWTGDSDPFGTIKCGETYSIRYLSHDDAWQATGLNEGNDEIVTSDAKAGDPTSNSLLIWGARFDFDSKGHVFVGADRVGHLEFQSGAVQ